MRWDSALGGGQPLRSLPSPLPIARGHVALQGPPPWEDQAVPTRLAPAAAPQPQTPKSQPANGNKKHRPRLSAVAARGVSHGSCSHHGKQACTTSKPGWAETFRGTGVGKGVPGSCPDCQPPSHQPRVGHWAQRLHTPLPPGRVSRKSGVTDTQPRPLPVQGPCGTAEHL